MHRTFALALALATATACSPVDPSAEAWTELLPDDRLLVDMPDAAHRAALGSPSTYRADAQAVAADVNGLIAEVLRGIDHITDFAPTATDEGEDTAQWGPWNDGAVDAMLTMQRFDDDHHAWALLVREAGGGDDAWVPFVAGEVDPGATVAQRSGHFVLDLSALADRDPSAVDPMWGRFVSTYAIDGDDVVAEAVFEDLRETPDGPAHDAVYSYTQGTDGGTLEAAWQVDLAGGAALETLALAVRWAPDGAGRGDAWGTDGDLGSLVYTGTECWDPAGGLVYAEDNASMQRIGEVDACTVAPVE